MITVRVAPHAVEHLVATYYSYQTDVGHACRSWVECRPIEFGARVTKDDKGVNVRAEIRDAHVIGLDVALDGGSGDCCRRLATTPIVGRAALRSITFEYCLLDIHIKRYQLTVNVHVGERGVEALNVDDAFRQVVTAVRESWMAVIITSMASLDKGALTGASEG